jgi:hypothetical protein
LRLASLEQPPRLFWAADVAQEKDDPRRPDPLQQGRETGRHFSPVETNDEELADRFVSFTHLVSP